MSTRLWFVRHGPTHADGFVGWKDLPADLSDTAALERLSDHLPDDAFVVSSDLIRASATADAIQAGRKRLDHNAGLREMDFGDWDGLTIDAVSKTHPQEIRQFWQEPGDTAAPNGESWNDLAGRISETVDGLIAEHGKGDIVVVAHFAVILTALQRASGMSARSAFSFKIDNLSLTRIDYLHDAGSWRIDGVNQNL